MIFHIAVKDLKIIFRDRKALLVMLLMPSLLILILGSALGSSFSQESAIKKFMIGVVNQDDGIMSGMLINQFLRGEMSDTIDTYVVDEQEALEMVESRRVPSVIVIPKDFSTSIQNQKLVKIEIRSWDQGQIRTNIVKSVVEGFAENISANYSVAFAAQEVFEQYQIPVEKPMKGMRDVDAVMQEMQQKIGTQMMEFKEVDQEKAKMPTAIQYYSAAMLVMFMLFGASIGSKWMLEEREASTLTRVLSSKANKATLITGKFLGLMAICLLQSSILIIFTAIVYGVNWGDSIPFVALVTICSTFASAAFGMFIAALSKTPKAADGLGTILIQVFTVLGGGMIPVYGMPSFMVKLSKFTLNAWATKGYTDLMMGASFYTILPYCGILILMGVAYLSIGVFKFKV